MARASTGARRGPAPAGEGPFRDRLVDRPTLDAFLERVRGKVRDPVAGLYGPTSMLWEINKHSIMFLGGGKAALLQLAHPYVAHGVDQHSATRNDPVGRFQRTFRNVFAMVYGDLGTALAAARRVHTIHTRITGPIREPVGAYAEGSPYRANEERALLWVHATLWETSVDVYERIVRPLTLAEKDAYYEESKLFAYLFGIPDRVLPPDWTQFMEYNRRMWESDELAVGAPAAEIASFLFKAPHRSLRPAFDQLSVLTAGLLPARFREPFGLPFGRRERRAFERMLTAVRLSHPAWPRRVRYVPAYVEARRRLAGNTGADPLGQALNLAFTGARSTAA